MISISLNSFSVNPTKWSNTLKQFVGNLPTNCLSVFDHFVGLALKVLKGSGNCTEIKLLSLTCTGIQDQQISHLTNAFNIFANSQKSTSYNFLFFKAMFLTTNRWQLEWMMISINLKCPWYESLLRKLPFLSPSSNNISLMHNLLMRNISKCSGTI